MPGKRKDTTDIRKYFDGSLRVTREKEKELNLILEAASHVFPFSSMSLEEDEAQESLKDILLGIRRDVRTLISRMDGLESKVENLESSIKADVTALKTDVNSLRSSQSQLESKVAEIKSGVEGNSQELDDIKTQVLPQVQQNFAEQVLAVQEEQLRLELYQRRRNLIFYGLHEKLNEDPEAELRSFLIGSMKLEPSLVNAMSFWSVHRLPRTRRPGFPADAPRGMIASFNKESDKEAVLQSMGRLKGTRQLVVTDLPSSMKAQRSRLVLISQRLRRKNKRTRIRQVDLKIELQVFNEGERRWLPYNDT
jgi:outer membrane murein-binding lipoprotein Lpp